MNNKTNCIIIHGCPPNSEELININDPGSYHKHWIPYIKKNLILKGIDTETPMMPTPWEPDYDAYKKEFEKYLINENTILIGHSCGCAFLVRWLGESKKKIKELILVAPWKIPKKDDSIKEKFYTFPIDETIKSRVQKIVIFTSDNEVENGKKSLDMYKEALGGKIIELKGRGHYVSYYLANEKFPELLTEII